MVYPEEPSIWTIPHIPALYDDDGDYGGKEAKKNIFCHRHIEKSRSAATEFNELE